jgi:hypothetical protein
VHAKVLAYLLQDVLRASQSAGRITAELDHGFPGRVAVEQAVKIDHAIYFGQGNSQRLTDPGSYRLGQVAIIGLGSVESR